ncbi:MAG: hypothetical protein ACJAWA_001660 [Nonlabens sp.]|jgi:hypothetical protein
MLVLLIGENYDTALKIITNWWVMNIRRLN